jgi:hypothetical protein
MRIFVGTKTGKHFPLEVEPSDTIENIKIKIMKSLKIPFESIELYLVFTLLEKNRLLSDYNIEEDSVITLVTVGYNKIIPFNSKKKNYDPKKMIEEKEKARQFLNSINLSQQNNSFKKLTGQTFDIHDLEMAQPNNKEKYEDRKEEIKDIGKKLLSETITNRETYFSTITELGQKIKENIIYETFNNPEKFIKPEELENSQEGSLEFIEGAFSSILSQNNITFAIEKESEDKEQAKLNLQLITSGEAFKKNLKISLSKGNETDALIISNETEREKFIKEKKTEYSKILNVPEENIIISHLEYGSVNFWVQYIDRDFTEEELKKIVNDAKNKGENIEVQLGCLLCACKISKDMFDSKGNRSSGWGKGEKRGPPNHLIDYDPPEGYFGYGLKVWDMYDNKDNTWLGYTNQEGEWYIAYHGTSGAVGQKILDGGFKAGDRQACKTHDNINELSKNKYGKLGTGVYCTPILSYAEGYAKNISFGGKSYNFIFMCRVNPKYVRMSSNNYWVVSGDSLSDQNAKKYDDEIRPYRILLKSA